jgi:hypothetical protein
MGLDFVEVSLEIESLFGVRLEPEHLLEVWQSHGNDCTVGEFHAAVCQLCEDSGRPVPRSSRNRVRVALARATGISPAKITMDAWLRRDLGFN